MPMRLNYKKKIRIKASDKEYEEINLCQMALCALLNSDVHYDVSGDFLTIEQFIETKTRLEKKLDELLDDAELSSFKNYVESLDI